MDFQSFVDYLAHKGILQEQNIVKIIEIYNDIDENDLRGFQMNN